MISGSRLRRSRVNRACEPRSAAGPPERGPAREHVVDAAQTADGARTLRERDSMKQLLTLVVFSAAAAIAAGAGTTVAAGAAGCPIGGSAEKTGPTEVTAHFCGPAVVTLQIGGKTEIFRSGSCFHANGAPGIIVEVGTQITNSGVVSNALKGGVPYIVLRLSATTRSNVAAYFGNTVVIENDGLHGVPISRNPYGLSGSFTGRSPRVSGTLKDDHPAATFSGRWNCGGTVLPGDDVVGIYLSSLKK